MNVAFAVANMEGKITRWGYCPEEDIALQAHAGEQVAQAELGVEAKPATHFMVDGVLASRLYPQCIISEMRLSRIPIPATIVIDGQAYESDSDTVDLDLPVPGVYKIEVIAWPYQTRTFTVIKE